MANPRVLGAFVYLLSVCLFVPFAMAQDKKDPQSTYEPRSGPGIGQKFLEKFVGDWDVVKTFHPRAGEPVKTKGECRQTMMHEGRFLRSDFVFGEGDRKTTGLGLIGFETATGKFTSVWTDSRTAGCHFGKAGTNSRARKSCCLVFNRSKAVPKRRGGRVPSRVSKTKAARSSIDSTTVPEPTARNASSWNWR